MLIPCLTPEKSVQSDAILKFLADSRRYLTP